MFEMRTKDVNDEMMWLVLMLAAYGFFVTLLLAAGWREFRIFGDESMRRIAMKDSEIARLRRLVK